MTTNITQPITKYKLVFLGDQSVGKTSIINRYINETFEQRQPVSLVLLIKLADDWYRFHQQDMFREQSITSSFDLGYCWLRKIQIIDT